ncbi:MAG: hypothetical protein ABI999_06175 [Acidobacteriota bacterium]
MKRCPECRRDYYDDTLLYCLDDGTPLLDGPVSMDEPQTAILSEPGGVATGFRGGEDETRQQTLTTEQTAILQTGAEAEPQKSWGDASEKQSLSANRAAKPLMAIGLAIIILIGGFFGYRYFKSAGGEQINSVAVLPFENRSGSTDTDYLSDGLADSLIYRLSQLPNLKVSPTSSVMRYKGKETDVAQIAKELEVDAVMSGRLVQRGDDLSISVQLIDSRSKKLIWAEQYDRKMADLLATQREIATTTTQKLQLKLAGDDTKGITKRYTDNNEAYQLYLKGRYHWGKRTLDDQTKAVDSFKAAIEKDDNFALAYSGLADTYSVLPFYQGGRANEFVNKGMPYAVRALELDNQLAETHSSLAFVNEGSWKWAEAESDYRRALELNPNYSSALMRFARFNIHVLNRDEEGLALIKRAVEIEPSSAVINDNLSRTYLSQGKADLALEQAKKTVALDPNFSFGWIDLAYSQLANGQTAGAWTSAQNVVEITKRSNRSLICLGFVAAASGHRDEIDEVLQELEQRTPTVRLTRRGLGLCRSG